MSPGEDKTMTDLLAPRARAAMPAIFMCSVAPFIATAADRGLGNDAAAACAALSGTGTGTTKIDAAALTEPQPLAVGASGGRRMIGHGHGKKKNRRGGVDRAAAVGGRRKRADPGRAHQSRDAVIL